MRYIIILMLSTLAFAELPEIVHSSISTYYENKTFSNSVQKDDGVVYGIGADVHYKSSAFKATYEYGDTNTKQPPLAEDLKTQKAFLRYGYEFNDKVAFNVNYINIIEDNIAITDGGVSYGLGLTLKPVKELRVNFTQFYTIYENFDVYQSDLRFDYKFKLDNFKFKISSLTKYITIDEKSINSFTKNADKDYLTSGVFLHGHYSGFHMGMAAYYGKRIFAIMDDGFKIQHHAMEFDRTYAIGVGKDLEDFVLRLQYIYQRAEEIPMRNENVEVSNVRVVLNYKF